MADDDPGPLNEPASTTSRDMSYGECRKLMSSRLEGRLGYLSGRGGRSVVVRYAVTDDEIMFLIPDYNEIAQYAPGHRVTLRIDAGRTAATSPRHETMSVTGTAHLADVQQAAAVARTDFSEAWPEGVATWVLCLPIDQIEGRRRELV
ncbi:MAG TPA: hypothetical protein VFP34_03735 [Microlunatus sp.]|nr:hypothetical protein [Microlunatus sp.]